jgi:hypothetical protein
MVFQFHAINKVKLPLKAKGTSIHDNNERLVEGVAHASLKLRL